MNTGRILARGLCGLAACLALSMPCFALAAEGRIALPRDLAAIEAESFAGTAAREIVVPRGCKSIGARAFAGSGAKWVRLPASVTAIAADAFAGCEGIVCSVDAGSYAQTWCIEHGVAWELSSDVPVAAISLSAEALALEPGETARLTASVLPENATQPDVTWQSSDPAVASVDGGVVTAIGEGEAVITAAAADGGGARAECAVRVANQTRYRALLIGEEEFYDSRGRVTERATRNAGDVTLMRAMLEGVTGPGGRSYSVATALNQSSDGVRSAIQRALGGADENDVSLFFIATHGDVDSTGDYAGALRMSSGGFLKLSQLASWLNAVPGRVIVIVESCGAGAAIYNEDTGEYGIAAEAAVDALAAFDRQVIRAFTSLGSTVSAPPEGAMFAGDFLVANKFFVLTASAYQELSWGVLNYNLFTKWLTDGVGASGAMPADGSKYAGNGDGVVTLYELYRYISIVGDKFQISRAGDDAVYYQHVQAYPSARSGSLPLFARG